MMGEAGLGLLELEGEGDSSLDCDTESCPRRDLWVAPLEWELCDISAKEECLGGEEE